MSAHVIVVEDEDVNPGFASLVTAQPDKLGGLTLLSCETTGGYYAAKERLANLVGQHIVFQDLNIEPGDVASILEAREALDCPQDVADRLRPGDWRGLRLIQVLLENRNWSGILAVSSKYNEEDNLWRIGWLATRYNRSDVPTECVPSLGSAAYKSAFDRALARYELCFFDVSARLWPDSAADWFKDDSSVDVTHSYNSVTAAGKQAFIKYVGDVTRCPNIESVVPHWFGEVMFPRLYEVVKRLVGAYSAAHTGGTNGAYGPYHLTLGGIVLLMASATDSPERWLRNVSWPVDNRDVLPAQTMDQARGAILALAGTGGLFPHLSNHETTKAPGVDSVLFSNEGLLVELGFGLGAITTRGTSFVQRVNEVFDSSTNKIHGGQLVRAYFNFLGKCGASHGSRRVNCVIDVLPREGRGSALLFKSC